MSTRKRKVDEMDDLRIAFKNISEFYLRLKPQLTKLSSLGEDARSSLSKDLQRLASLAEAFTAERARGKVNADVRELNVLDQEGVNLWNISGLMHRDHFAEAEEDRQLFASLRLSGFRMIEAGLEAKPSLESLTNVLQVASKASLALSDAGRHDLAARVVACAAGYEERLRELAGDEQTCSNATLGLSTNRAMMLYYCSRMVNAWSEGNHGVAEYMLDKIGADNTKIKELSAFDREAMATRTFHIGKGILRSSARPMDNCSSYTSDQKNAQVAIKWLQRSFSLVEEHKETESLHILKGEILRTLARAYFLGSASDPDNLLRAETTLDELVLLLGHRSGEAQGLQQCLWMKLAVLKRRHAKENELLETFNSIVDHSDFSESSLTDILQELRTLSQHDALPIQVLRHCLLKLLTEANHDNREAVSRVFLTLLFHSSKDTNHERAISNARDGCSLLMKHNFELEQTPSVACVTILWQAGDKHYHDKHWEHATDWYLLATHDSFSSIAQISESKCLRKAALCYIELKEYASASAVIDRCSCRSASTYYLRFLVAMRQGMEGQAAEAICKLVDAQDFKRSMLLLAIRLTHESGNKSILLASLNSLLKILLESDDTNTTSESILIIRCIVRLLLALCRESDEHGVRISLVEQTVGHLRSAIRILQRDACELDVSSVSRDISWLWRIAYNTAVQACGEWEHADQQICDLFELSSLLLQAYEDKCATAMDVETRVLMVHSSFASIAGRVFLLRRSNLRQHTLSEITHQIERARFLITRFKGENEDELERQAISKVEYALRLFEVEVSCRSEDWDRIQAITTEITDIPLETCEAIIGLLWSCESCPLPVLYAALEAMLHSCLQSDAIGIRPFSRWLRALCTVLLARNRVEDRKKAISYIEQALPVLQQGGCDSDQAQSFPVEEQQWLLSTTYNTGLECMTRDRVYLTEAKRWLEASVFICRIIPNGQDYVKQVSDLYEQIVECIPGGTEG